MIGRTNRFHGRAGIVRVQRTGQLVRSGPLALRFGPNPRLASYRLAVVVSRKVSKSAVVRNRIRRRLYARVRILFSSLAVPYDMVLMAYDERLATMAPADLDAEVAKIMQKAQLTSAEPSPGRAIVKPKSNDNGNRG